MPTKPIALVKARRSRRLTQAELAARIGKPQSFISKLETGVLRDPTFRDVVALARALDVDPLSLRFGPDRREAVA